MNRQDYNKLMEEEIKSFGGQRKRLLLHACCAPCSSACLERLKDFFDITVLFYNPNIEDGEYYKRKTELIKLLNATGWAQNIDCDRDTDKFATAICGLEREKEGGKRCVKCFELRLDKTAEIAAANGFDAFTTTLTISPLKNAQIINAVGEAAAKRHNVRWLHSDFKKKDGYLRSLQLTKEYGLYRQNYCGCIYSQNTLEK